MEIINKKARDILYNAFLDNIIDAKEKDVSGMFEIASLVGLAQEIRDSEANGRVIVDLINDSSIDLYTVKEGDELHIHTLDLSAKMSPHNNVATHIQKNNGSPINYLLKPPRNVGISNDAKP